MKIKKYFLRNLALLLLIFSVFTSLNFNSGEDFITHTHPRPNAEPTPIFPDKDTYVDTGSPISNFGGQNYLYIGISFSDIHITYLHYNFSQKPASFEKAYLQIDPNIISETMNFTIRLHDSSEPWDELALTYMNQPENIIDTLEYRFKYDKRGWIEITSFFDSHSLTELYLSINASIYHNNYFTTYSKEAGYSWVDPITLIFVESGDTIDMSPEYEYEPSENQILPTMDSYVDTYYPLANFGGMDEMKIGMGFLSNLYASIIRFENIPTTATVMTLSIDLWAVYETLDLLITVYSGMANLQEWDEFDLTWVEWPYGSPVDYMNDDNVNLTKVVSASEVVSIDLSDWVGNDTIDIILTFSTTTDEYIDCYSKEGFSSYSEPPVLITDIKVNPNIDPEDTDPGTDPTDPNDDSEGNGISGFPFISIICLISLSRIFKNKRKAITK